MSADDVNHGDTKDTRRENGSWRYRICRRLYRSQFGLSVAIIGFLASAFSMQMINAIPQSSDIVFYLPLLVGPAVIGFLLLVSAAMYLAFASLYIARGILFGQRLLRFGFFGGLFVIAWIVLIPSSVKNVRHVESQWIKNRAFRIARVDIRDANKLGAFCFQCFDCGRTGLVCQAVEHELCSWAGQSCWCDEEHADEDCTDPDGNPLG